MLEFIAIILAVVAIVATAVCIAVQFYWIRKLGEQNRRDTIRPRLGMRTRVSNSGDLEIVIWNSGEHSAYGLNPTPPIMG